MFMREVMKNLDAEQMKKLREFILRKQHCFAKPGEVGRTNLGHHEINLKNEKPIREPPRRILYIKDKI